MIRIEQIDNTRIIKTPDARIVVPSGVLIEILPPDFEDICPLGETEQRKLIFFKISLAAANLTEMEFARRAGVSRQALQKVLRGKMRSQNLERRIARFITRRMGKLRIVLHADQVESQNRQAQKSAARDGKTARRLANAFNQTGEQ